VDAQLAASNVGGGPTVVGQTSRGDVDLTAVAFQDPTQRGSGQGQGRGGPPPTAAECKLVADAYARNPAVRARIDSLGATMRSGGDVDRQAIMAAMTSAYGTLGVDAMLARRCGRVLNPQAAEVGVGQGARNGGRGGSRGGAGSRTGLVFVAVNGTYQPRVIQMGLASYDYTEVTSGIEEGEAVVLLTSAQLQQQQQQQRDQMRARQGGPLGQPGGGSGQRGAGGNPGGGGGGGGRPPGGD